MRSSLSRSWLAAVSSASLLGLMLLPATANAAAHPNLLLPRQLNVVSPNAIKSADANGPVAPSQQWAFGLVLPSQNPAGLAQMAQAVSDPSSPDYGHYLTHAQLMSQYGPNPGLAHMMTRYLQNQGFTVTAQGQMLTVSGTAAQVDALFSTKLETFTRGHGRFVAPSGAITIPTALRQAAGISGLVLNAAQPQLSSHITPARSMPLVHWAPATAMKPAPAGTTSTSTQHGMTVTAQLLSQGSRVPGMAVRYLITVTEKGQPDLNAQFDGLSGPFQGAESPVMVDANQNGQFLMDFTLSQAQQVSLALTVNDQNNPSVTDTVQLPIANFQGPSAKTTQASSLFGSSATGTIIAPWNPASNSIVSAVGGQGLQQAAVSKRPATVAIYTAADVAQGSTSDVNAFASQFGLPAPKVSVAYLGPNACTSSIQACAPYMFDFQAELSLDMTMVETASPGANIEVYEAGSLRSALNQVLTQDTAKVFSLSYGTGEIAEQQYAATAQSTWDMLAEEANLEGITISVSAGDSGAYEGAESGLNQPMPSYPANSPYVSALGGTEESVNPDGGVNQIAMWGGNIGSELSTPELLSFLSLQNMIAGGGYSTLEPVPFYQSGYVSPQQGRGNPDFSLPASVVTPGYFVYIGGTPYYVGGTSASAPLFAGFMGDMTVVVHHGLGNVNPLIYALYSRDPAIMSTVAYGNNGNGQAVTPGYNAATGLGQLNVGQLYEAVAGPRSSSGY